MNTIRDAEDAITGGALDDVETGISELHAHRKANPKAFYALDRRSFTANMAKRLEALAARARDLVR